MFWIDTVAHVAAVANNFSGDQMSVMYFKGKTVHIGCSAIDVHVPIARRCL